MFLNISKYHLLVPFLIADAKNYTRLKIILSCCQMVIVISVMAYLYFSGRSQSISKTLMDSMKNRWTPFYLIVLIMYMILLISELPISIISGFYVERAFDLSKISFGTWAIKYLKGAGIGILLSPAAAFLLYLCINKSPKFWFAIVMAGVIFFQIAYSYLYPNIVIPIFYSPKPVSSKLSADIDKLVSSAGYRSAKIYEINYSIYTKKPNAFFTGILGNRKIFLTDNLLDNFSDNEIKFVLAHEIAHDKLHHIPVMLALGIFSAAAFLFLYRLIFRGISFVSSRGSFSDPSSLAFIILFFFLLTVIAMPLQNYISRKMETDADRMALELTGDPDSMRSAIAKLSQMNKSDPNPPEWVEFIFYSHPSAQSRIKMAENYTSVTNFTTK
jgi:STE24 endopeptidase